MNELRKHIVSRIDFLTESLLGLGQELPEVAGLIFSRAILATTIEQRTGAREELQGLLAKLDALVAETK